MKFSNAGFLRVLIMDEPSSTAAMYSTDTAPATSTVRTSSGTNRKTTLKVASASHDVGCHPSDQYIDQRVLP